MQLAINFTGKAKAWDTIKQLGFNASISVEAPCYLQNLENPQFPFMGFNKNADGTATLEFPFVGENSKVPFFDVKDLGMSVQLHSFCDC